MMEARSMYLFISHRYAPYKSIKVEYKWVALNHWLYKTTKRDTDEN